MGQVHADLGFSNGKVEVSDCNWRLDGGKVRYRNCQGAGEGGGGTDSGLLRAQTERQGKADTVGCGTPQDEGDRVAALVERGGADPKRGGGGTEPIGGQIGKCLWGGIDEYAWNSAR